LLGTLGGAQGSSVALAINDPGQVVGYSYTADGSLHATLWSHGATTDLGTLPGGTISEATGINNRGDIVGWSTYGGTSYSHAFLWTDGIMIDLGTLGDTRPSPTSTRGLA
jgi:probable HAF family extracellular repeat protein